LGGNAHPLDRVREPRLELRDGDVTNHAARRVVESQGKVQ
jgi:hypothetical protein